MAITSSPELPQRDTLTLPEWCDRTGTPLPTAYDWIAQGRFPLPLLRLGRTYRISRRAHEAWLDGLTLDDTADT